MKKLFSLRKVLILCLLIATIGMAKVDISGNINVWFDTSRHSNNQNTKQKKAVGNMDDQRFIEKAFIINNKGYSFLLDNYGNKLLLKVIFNSDGEVIQEYLYETTRFTNNCLGIKDNDSFCFTITKDGLPSIWDRYRSRYLYYGKFVNVRIQNPYKRKYYDEDNFFNDLFEF